MVPGWTDYDNAYLARRVNGAWRPFRKIAAEKGAKDNIVVADPRTGAVHMLIQARKDGFTCNNSWDLLHYEE